MSAESPLQVARDRLNKPGIVVVGEVTSVPTTLWDELRRVFVIPTIPTYTVKGMDAFYRKLRDEAGLEAPKGSLVRQEGSDLKFSVLKFDAPKRRLLVLGFPDIISAQEALDYRTALTERGGEAVQAEYAAAGKAIPDEHVYHLKGSARMGELGNAFGRLGNFLKRGNS